MTTMTSVSTCEATRCAFNNAGSCAATAITIAGGADSASCVTFAELDIRATTEGAGQVGACHRIECVHNKDLACTAETTTVSDTAVCVLYETR